MRARLHMWICIYIYICTQCKFTACGWTTLVALLKFLQFYISTVAKSAGMGGSLVWRRSQRQAGTCTITGFCRWTGQPILRDWCSSLVTTCAELRWCRHDGVAFCRTHKHILTYLDFQRMTLHDESHRTQLWRIVSCIIFGSRWKSQGLDDHRHVSIFIHKTVVSWSVYAACM